MKSLPISAFDTYCQEQEHFSLSSVVDSELSRLEQETAVRGGWFVRRVGIFTGCSHELMGVDYREVVERQEFSLFTRYEQWQKKIQQFFNLTEKMSSLKMLIITINASEATDAQINAVRNCIDGAAVQYEREANFRIGRSPENTSPLEPKTIVLVYVHPPLDLRVMRVYPAVFLDWDYFFVEGLLNHHSNNSGRLLKGLGSNSSIRLKDLGVDMSKTIDRIAYNVSKKIKYFSSTQAAECVRELEDNPMSDWYRYGSGILNEVQQYLTAV